MTSLDIVRWRLHNQHITRQTFAKPVDVIQWLGAVQAQDYTAAKWALGLRLHNAIDDDIERAFADGAILRTHVMRPTWHFVAPTDIRWLLALTAPRVKAILAHYDRQLELDDAVFLQSNTALTKALECGKQLTRTELASVLQQVGIEAKNGQRLTHLMMHAELDGVICSGARRGKQFTYALLDERTPQTEPFDHDEALAEFIRRYFTSHGPATLQDFAWWSGLTAAETKDGLHMNTSQLLHETIDGQTYWFAETISSTPDTSPTVYLLPNYDEYTVSYKDRSAILAVPHTSKLDTRSSSPFNHVIVLNGRIAGIWKRTLEKDKVQVILNPFTQFSDAETRAVAAVADHYGAFLELPVHCTNADEHV